MAKFTPGPAVASISGSVGGTTFSHNTYGQYMRRRAIPTISTTPDALAAKARLTSTSQAWLGLTAAERLAWAAWAQQNPITDALGQSQVLTGNAGFVRLNTLLEQGVFATLTVPPVTVPPPSLLTLALTADVGLGNVEIAYTATPTGADDVLVVKAAVTNSPAINYVRNLLRIVSFSGLAEASPFDIETAVVAKFGTLVVGTFLHVEVFTLDSVTGLRSQPLRADVIVTTT